MKLVDQYFCVVRHKPTTVLQITNLPVGKVACFMFLIILDVLV